ncbi:MAG: NADH-ubiquinone/plastoquinone oxidoreductase subunit 6 [Acidobacteria bacterium RIFCSPHIGHO2_02_FULL_67_57]|nr:MAG: NADH-ubiquinone/plastoquinone oxidoreductase subunit 6 [Acidobacteria bacterium RIFCSPHIGHO2_02_FULL_67_57]
MSFAQAVFYALAGVAVVSALLVITRRNPVHSAIWLIITLLSVALLYLQLQAEFIAAVQIILYIGGIMVLFLFVIMLVNLDVALRQEQFNRQWGVAGLAALLLAAELAGVIYLGRGTAALPQAPPGALQPNTELIGSALYQAYMLPFEIASLLLLVAMVGAVVMARRRTS